MLRKYYFILGLRIFLRNLHIIFNYLISLTITQNLGGLVLYNIEFVSTYIFKIYRAFV